MVLLYYPIDYDGPSPIPQPILFDIAFREPLQTIVLIIFGPPHLLEFNDGIVHPTSAVVRLINHRGPRPKVGILPPNGPSEKIILVGFCHLLKINHCGPQLESLVTLGGHFLKRFEVDIVDYANQI